MKLNHLGYWCLTLILSATVHGESILADPIPAARKVNWTYAGVPKGIPNRTTICATFSPGASASAINTAIISCSSTGGGVVQLMAGTYTAASLNGTIELKSDNVTLRGAGADKTILKGGSILTMGRGYNLDSGIAIIGGGLKDSNTITVASTAGLSVGTIIEIDRDNDPNLIVLAPNRAVTQVNAITKITGNILELRNPLFYDYTKGNPKIKFTFSMIKGAGAENFKMDHAGFQGGYNASIEYCDSCWLKGVESANATGYHFVLLGTLNMELRDSYIHDGGSGPNNSGYNFYGNYIYGANSSAKIENNIFNKNFPAIELNNSSSGFFIGYNYSHGSASQFGNNLVTWTFDDGHAPMNIMNLYEGNIGEQWGADNYYGGSGYGTALRNHFTGVNKNFNVTGEAVWLDRMAYNYNVIGNVLGSAAQKSSGYESCGSSAIYRTLGTPNLGNCDSVAWDGVSVPGGYPDAKVRNTLLRWGNYDYFNKATRFSNSEVPADVPVPADQIIPASYYYSSRPSWWPADRAFPPIGPDVKGGDGDSTGMVYKIPAQVCFESRNLLSGGTFSAAECFGSGSGTAPAPQPTAQLIASKSSIVSGESVALTWSSTVATSCTGSGFNANNMTSGSISVSPTASTTYSVSCGGANASVMVTVTAPAPQPQPTAQISVSKSSIVSGESIVLSWSSTVATSCVATGFNSNNMTSGSIKVAPTASITYGVTCGTAVAKVAVTVSPLPQPQPQPQPGESLFQGLNGATYGEAVAYELGTIFSANVPGQVTAIRIYLANGESGQHVARIWNNSTRRVVAGPFTFTPNGSGWFVYNLPSPLAISAKVNYTVSVSTGTDSARSYVAIPRALASAGGNNRNLKYPANAGVYSTSLGRRPTSSFNSNNYLRDIVFKP